MKKLLVMLLMLITSPVWADEYPAEKTHNIGFTLGSSHGSGIHYARQHSDGWGVQITGFPLWVAEERILIAGFATIYNINKGKKGRVFASFGLGYSYRRSEWNNWNSSTGRDEVQIDEDTYYLFGPGIGMERIYAKNFAVSVTVPACISLGGEEGLQILPIPNFSVGYTW